MYQFDEVLIFVYVLSIFLFLLLLVRKFNRIKWWQVFQYKFESHPIQSKPIFKNDPIPKTRRSLHLQYAVPNTLYPQLKPPSPNRSGSQMA